MNANAAIFDNDELAAIEREEAEKLAPEIVRDLNQMAAEQEAIADKLPAELASISEMFSAMVERKTEIARKAAEDIAEVDAQMLRTLNQVLRRVAVKEEMLARKVASEKVTLKNIEIAIGSVLSAVEIISDTTDGAAAVAHETEEYGRLYREQYEHAPEPPDDDGGSRAPVVSAAPEYTHAAADMEIDGKLGADLDAFVAWVNGPRDALPPPPASLRTRVLRASKAFFGPSEFIRRNASPPFRAA